MPGHQQAAEVVVMNALASTLHALSALDEREKPEPNEVQHIVLSDGSVLEALLFQIMPGEWIADDANDQSIHGIGQTADEALRDLIDQHEAEIQEERVERADVVYADSLGSEDLL
jgi:hypothetical protein